MKLRSSLATLLLLSVIVWYPSSAQTGITLIHDIQGTPAHPDYPDSPYENVTVTVEGVVVGDFQDGDAGLHGDINGFYVQEEDAQADDDPQSSEGIFVFERRGTIVDVHDGDVVRVTGTVDEIRGLTQITATEVEVTGIVDLLPDPVSVQFPLESRMELEYYENMLVTLEGINEPFTVNDTYDLGRYGVIQLTSDGRVYQYTQLYQPSTAEAFQAYLEEIGKRVILIDDGRTNENTDQVQRFNGAPFSAINSVRSGYQVESVTGILEFRFDEWRVQPTQPLQVITTENPRPTTNREPGSVLRVAAFNLLNYFNGDGLGDGFPTPRGADTSQEFQRQRAKILAALIRLDADIIGVIEIENDFGSGEDSAIADLVDGLNDAPIPTRCGTNWGYVDVNIPPLNLSRLGTDAIAVGFIYCAQTVTMTPGTVPAILTDEMLPALGLADLVPTYSGVNTSRVPLAVTFRELTSDEDVTIVINHLKSKGGDGAGADADIGDGVASWNQRRRAAVIALDAWLATNPTGTADPDILLIGDFNAYAMEDPIQDLLALGYSNLVDMHAYSFGFPLVLGQSPETQGWGTLDYAFANATLQSQVSSAFVWPINADEPIYLDYNLEFKPETLIDTLYAPDPYRSSDHDPVVVDMELGDN